MIDVVHSAPLLLVKRRVPMKTAKRNAFTFLLVLLQSSDVWQALVKRRLHHVSHKSNSFIEHSRGEEEEEDDEKNEQNYFFL